VEGLYTRCDDYGKDEIPVALCEAAGLVGKRRRCYKRLIRFAPAVEIYLTRKAKN